MPRLLLLILFSLIVIQCTKSPISEGASEQSREQHVFILDAIPAHIEEIESLTVFPGDSEPKYSIDLIPKQTYGKTGEPYLTKIYRIVVDDQGRVIILDARQSDHSAFIHVYNDDGSYYTKLGGQGKGPGEYGHVFGLEAKASKIFVLDFTSQRLNEYSTKDYSLVRTIPLEQWKSGGESGYVEARNDILLNQYAQ